MKTPREETFIKKEDSSIDNHGPANQPEACSVNSISAGCAEGQATHTALGQARPTSNDGTIESKRPSGVDGSNVVTVSALDASSFYSVIYEVCCSTKYYSCDGRSYTEHPKSIVLDNGQAHLASGQPVTLGSILRVAFVIRRIVTCLKGFVSAFPRPYSRRLPSGQPISQEFIWIRSLRLDATLRRISTFAPNSAAYPLSFSPYSCPPGFLSRNALEYTPYFFYHHRETLLQLATTNHNDRELATLCAYIEKNPDPMYSLCDRLFGLGLVSAETLPWLFRPNEVVVVTGRPFLIAAVLQCPPQDRQSDGIELKCWSWAYDGTSLRRKDTKVMLKMPCRDPIPITELKAYPLRYASPETKRHLVERGSRFWALRNPSYVSYEGPNFEGVQVYPRDSKFIIDYTTFRTFPNSSDVLNFLPPRNIPFDQRPQEIKVASKEELSEEDIMLLPPSIHGFSLKDKEWVQLRVDNISTVAWNKEAFNKLVLPPHMKNYIKSLVLARKRQALITSPGSVPAARSSDLVSGKGGGLIMLLHGDSGTGKTLTAESVAEMAEMPLLTAAYSQRTNLELMLRLGLTWNCILLLDDVDVLLKSEFLVHDFLHKLENYSGILMLTSKRVNNFNATLKSRIHVTLHYPPLDRPTRRAVWVSFLDMLRDDGQPLDYDSVAAHLDKLAAYEMNGRQIRNAVTTASRLALFEKAPMRWDHVELAASGAASVATDSDSLPCHAGTLWAGQENNEATNGVSTGTARKKRRLD